MGVCGCGWVAWDLGFQWAEGLPPSPCPFPVVSQTSSFRISTPVLPHTPHSSFLIPSLSARPSALKRPQKMQSHTPVLGSFWNSLCLRSQRHMLRGQGRRNSAAGRPGLLAQPLFRCSDEEEGAWLPRSTPHPCLLSTPLPCLFPTPILFLPCSLFLLLTYPAPLPSAGPSSVLLP